MLSFRSKNAQPELKNRYYGVCTMEFIFILAYFLVVMEEIH